MAPSPQQCGSRPADTTPRNRRSRSADPNTSQRSPSTALLARRGRASPTSPSERWASGPRPPRTRRSPLSTPTSRPAATSWTPPTSTAPARRRRHSAAGSPTGPRTSPTASFLRPRDGSESAPTSSAPRRAGVHQDGIRRQHRAARNDARDLCGRATTGRGGRGGVLGVRQRAVGRRRDDRQGRHGRKAELRYPAGRQAKQLRTLRRIVPARTFDKQIHKFNRLPGLTNWRRGSPQHLAELVF